jgi:GNAT superfamily N-acetyltransferase
MTSVQIHPYETSRWGDLWAVRFNQLAEHGIILPPVVPPIDEPFADGDPEYDYYCMQDMYLRGVGNFWLAFLDDVPVGHIGAQDIDGQIELRRMFVDARYRRRGIGSALVNALIEHAMRQHVDCIELWTASHGVGEQLYRHLGFKVVPEPSSAFANVTAQTRYVPGQNEVRMQLRVPFHA